MAAVPCNAPRKAAAILSRRQILAVGRGSYDRSVIPPSVQPWARCDPRRLRDLGGVLTDIDDTLTTEGAIPMGVVAALAALRAAGLPVVAVTGRPMGWSLPIAAEVPLAAVVAENGAVALIPDGAGGVRTEYADSEPVREANALRLAAAAARIVREVPGATLVARQRRPGHRHRHRPRRVRPSRRGADRPGGGA